MASSFFLCRMVAPRIVLSQGIHVFRDQWHLIAEELEMMAGNMADRTGHSGRGDMPRIRSEKGS